MNAGHGYSTFWAPVVNLAREPRWGRNLESAGEDPYLSSEYSVAFVHGFERLTEEPRYLAASACCKHYVANSRELRAQRACVIGLHWTTSMSPLERIELSARRRTARMAS